MPDTLPSLVTENNMQLDADDTKTCKASGPQSQDCHALPPTTKNPVDVKQGFRACVTTSSTF
jgi:hypothetical protein